MVFWVITLYSLDTWDQNGSTSGPTPWQIYDDDNDDSLIHGHQHFSLTYCITATLNLKASMFLRTSTST